MSFKSGVELPLLPLLMHSVESTEFYVKSKLAILESRICHLYKFRGCEFWIFWIFALFEDRKLPNLLKKIQSPEMAKKDRCIIFKFYKIDFT